MKLLLIAALAIGALARIEDWSSLDESSLPRSIDDQVFRPGREYQFIYNGQMTTGIPGSSRQHSASRIQTLVTLAFKGPNQVVVRLSNIRFGKLNREIPNPRNMLPLTAYEEVPVEEQLKATLEKPVKFSYTGGLVHDVVFERTEMPWSSNIKRGVLNLLQVNLKEHRRVDTSEEQRLSNIVRSEETDASFFRSMEETLEGECETVYTINRQPSRRYSSGPVLNVTKTINFERCNKRPQIKYNFRFSDPCPTCESKYNEDEKFLKSSTIAKYNISGTRDSFLIESARIESHYIFTPFNEESNVIVSYVNQTLVLIKTGPISSAVHEPREPMESDSDMIYTLDWDISKERFHMEGHTEFLDKHHYSQIPEKQEVVKDLLLKMVRHMREAVDEEAPRMFSRLVTLMRLCSRQEIEQIHQSFYHRESSDFTPEEQKKIKDILPDAIALCGSKACIEHLVAKIRSNDIPVVRAVLALKSLINTRTVSKEIIQELMTLTTEPAERNWFLKQATWLTIGSMMNALCTPNEDTLAREYKESPEKFCSRELKTQYSRVLFEKFRSAEKWEDKIMFLKAIGNAGLDMSIFDLEKIIRNDMEPIYPTYLRVEAILAMRQLKDVMPKKVQKVLMPIVLHKFENPHVRMAASYMTLQTLPERPVLDQLAKMVFVEPSKQVASFVFTYMDTLANSTNPCEKKLATDLKLALRHIKRVDVGLLYSKFWHMPMQSKHYKTGLDMDFGYEFNNRSFLPRHVALDLHANKWGFWHKYLLSAGLVGEGMEPLLQRFLGERGYAWERNLDELLRRHPRQTMNEYESELRGLFSSLNIRGRDSYRNSEMESSEPKAYMYLKLKDQSFGILPLKEEWMRNLMSEGGVNIREWESKLRAGYPININKALYLHEVQHKIPTTLGMPLTITVKIPTVLSLKGKIQSVIEPQDRMKSFKIHADLKPSIVSTMITEVEAWSPVVNHGVKIVAKAKLFAPIDANLELDMRSEEKVIKLTVKPPTTRRELVVLETRPVSYTRVWPRSLKVWEEPEEKTIMGEEMQRVKTFNKCYGRNTVGVEFCARGHIHQTPYKHLKGTPMSPFSGPNKIVISTEPGNEMPEEITARFTGQFLQSGSEALRSSFSRFTSFEETESNERSEEKTFRNYETTSPLKNVLRMEVNAKGRKLNAELTHHFDWEMRYSKLTGKISRSPLPSWDNEPWMACLESEVMFPNKPYSVEELTGKKVVSTTHLNWGRSCSAEKFVTIKTQVERSQQQIDDERDDPEYRMYQKCEDKSWCSPVSQYNYLSEASRLLKYRVDIDYQNVPVVMKNLTTKALQLLKYAYFWQSDIAQIQVRNPENKVRVVLTVDPETEQYVNLTIKTPQENITIHDIPVPFKIFRLNTKRSTVNGFLDYVTDDRMEAVCHISSRLIDTFDNVQYTVPLTTCYSVVAKDCSDESKFAVMVKKQSQESELKQVKIVTRHHRIVLMPTSEDSNKIAVEVNGRRYNNAEEVEDIKEHGHTLVRVDKEGPYVKVELPETGIRVFFDGYAANIKMSHMYRNTQCGLCGHFDMEEQDEFRNPDFTEEDDVRQFHLNYMVKDGQCDSSIPSDLNRICEDEDCDYKPYWETTDKIETSQEMDEDDEPVLRTKVIEQGHEICFSIERIKTCPRNAYAVKHETEKTVQYGCLPRDDHDAEIYQRRAKFESEVPEVRRLTVSFTRTERVPEKCKSYETN